MPRLCSRPSTFLSDSGIQAYIFTTLLKNPGLEPKQPKGKGQVLLERLYTPCTAQVRFLQKAANAFHFSGQVPLTSPKNGSRG